MTDAERYRAALVDWLACAAGGAGERSIRAARAAGDGLLDRVAAAGAAGHVLDYDDTYAPGVVHLSAPVAPAALVLGAELGVDTGTAMAAYAAGFEAAAALARASHPALYAGGWHPTAVCGTVGAALAAARLLGLDGEREQHAMALAALRAGGLRAAFGSDGKALQVGMAAASGVQAARLVAAGAVVPLDAVANGPAGFEQAFGGCWAVPGRTPAVRENWIKAYPCCLATHSTIEAVAELSRDETRGGTELTVVVHPLARQAAPFDDVGDGLEAKFSLPYLAACSLLRGPPTLGELGTVDAEARALARDKISVRVDESLGEWEARLEIDGEVVARVEVALGSPQRPLDPGRFVAKIRELAGDRLDGAADDLTRPAGDLLAAAGLA